MRRGFLLRMLCVIEMGVHVRISQAFSIGRGFDINWPMCLACSRCHGVCGMVRFQFFISVVVVFLSQRRSFASDFHRRIS